jgi:hypothetical protein
MPFDILIVLLIVCTSFVCVFLVSTPGEKFINAIKRLMGIGNIERRNRDG